MNIDIKKMAVWCSQLNMYLLVRQRSRTGPLPHLQRQTQIKVKLLLWGAGGGGSIKERTSPANTS
jgi:hypothetical protein